MLITYTISYEKMINGSVATTKKKCIEIQKGRSYVLDVLEVVDDDDDDDDDEKTTISIDHLYPKDEPPKKLS